MARHQPWLLVTVATGASSTLRVHAWRTLRSAGAVYLQQSVALLPKRPDTEKLVARLLDRLRRDGGSGRALTIAILGDEERTVIDQFRSERADEYREVCSRVPDFIDEIESERAKGRLTYNEVEESAADLDRLRTWLRRIEARDYFEADGRKEAEAAVARCAELLDQFEAEALAAESTATDSTDSTGQERARLRAVQGERR